MHAKIAYIHLTHILIVNQTVCMTQQLSEELVQFGSLAGLMGRIFFLLGQNLIL